MRRTPVTLLVLAVIWAAELVLSWQGEPARLYMYNDVRLATWVQIWVGDWWRPFTSTLLHVNLVHALMNGLALCLFGGAIEQRWGPWRYLALMVGLAYVASLSEYAVWPSVYGLIASEPLKMHPALGISGVVYGFFGLMWAGRERFEPWQELCSEQTVRIMLTWLVLCVVFTLTEILPVANVAHFAGLGAGWLFGKFLYSRHHRPVWLAAAVALCLPAIACWLFCPPTHPHYQTLKALKRFQSLGVSIDNQSLNYAIRPPAANIVANNWKHI